MADTAKVAVGRIGEEDVSAQINCLRGPLKTSAGASQFAQLHLGIDRDRTSMSLGIALAVTMEPMSETRRTPEQASAARTKESTASSSGRRGSATEGEGL
jgi:hypothetical protein